MRQSTGSGRQPLRLLSRRRYRPISGVSPAIRPQGSRRLLPMRLAPRRPKRPRLKLRQPTRRTVPARTKSRRQAIPAKTASPRRPRNAAAAVRVRLLRLLRPLMTSSARKWRRRARAAWLLLSFRSACARASSPSKNSGIRILQVTSPTSRACACTSKAVRTGSRRSNGAPRRQRSTARSRRTTYFSSPAVKSWHATKAARSSSQVGISNTPVRRAIMLSSSMR